MSAQRLLRELRALGTEQGRASARRFAITSAGEILGVPVPQIRRLARGHGPDLALAAELWATGVFEARILATLVADPSGLTRRHMNQWARQCDNWAITDSCCLNLFVHTRFAVERVRVWSSRKAEFEKRCGFALMAALAVHAKTAPDAVFRDFLPLIRREATDPRNFVKKAVNWALRQIGKRNPRLRRAAIAEAKAIRQIDSPAARWIAADALRELVLR